MCRCESQRNFREYCAGCYLNTLIGCAAMKVSGSTPSEHARIHPSPRIKDNHLQSKRNRVIPIGQISVRVGRFSMKKGGHPVAALDTSGA
jgi:hypothetical protein